MKLLFLDIDGVLTSNNTQPNSSFLYTFSKDCVTILNRILCYDEVKIILTSSWRIVFDIEQQIQIFKENGVLQYPYGQTKDLGYENRGLEIKNYLQSEKVTHFVILDDMEIEGFDNNFVRINPSTGLTDKYVERINKVLNL